MLTQVMTLITLQFKSDSVTVEYQGEVRRFDFEYRDPWEWILALIHDKSLASLCMWNSVRNFIAWEKRKNGLLMNQILETLGGKLM